MNKLIFPAMLAALCGCTVTSPPKTEAYDRIRDEVAKTGAPKGVPDSVSAALLPPLSIELPRDTAPEERFNVAFNNLSAPQFFTALATGTRYNMLVHPRVSGQITVDLKNVTLFEALDAVRDLYGYDYSVEGNRILIRPVELRTRIFRVNYLNSSRSGFSDIRVTSGAAGDTSGAGGTTSTSTGTPAGTSTTTTSGSTPQTVETSKIHTASATDFWRELKTSLEAVIGVERAVVATAAGGGAAAQQAQAAAQQAAAQQAAALLAARTGAAAADQGIGTTTQPCRGENSRCVVVNPQSGIVVVRAMPEELRSVEAFLKATQLSVDRQVMLEAKIIEVQLNDGFQSGVNWATFARFGGNSANQVASGFVAPGTTLLPLAPGTAYPQTISSGGNTAVIAQPGIGINIPDPNAVGVALGSMFSFAFQATNFSALISFLETQGTVQVLSSPRISTLNNQKAVLKIGVDELFVTNVTSSNTTAVGGVGTIQPPTVTLQSYFSGIVLDVTPQVDDRGNINLHIRPSVTSVTQVNKVIDVGSSRPFQLPVPSSNTSETDSIVRGRDGQVIVIGGLMRYAGTADRSQVPGAGDVPGVGPLFRNRNESNQKRELVILLKPTVIPEAGNWAEDLAETQRRVQQLDPRTQFRSYEWQTPSAR
jgi:MSHA biogenesis protein MshL